MNVTLELSEELYQRLQKVRKKSAEQISTHEAALTMVIWGLNSYEDVVQKFEKTRSELTQWMDAKS